MPRCKECNTARVILGGQVLVVGGQVDAREEMRRGSRQRLAGPHKRPRRALRSPAVLHLGVALMCLGAALTGAVGCGAGAPKPPPTALVLEANGRLSPQAAADRQTAVSRVTPQIQAQAQTLVDRGLTPGLAVGVVLDGALLWSGGFGLRVLGRPGFTPPAGVTKDTVFRIASITKTMTALVLLSLRDEGRLRLDDPAARYIPALANVRKKTTDSPEITLRHLITHTSGLPRIGGVDYTSRATIPLSEPELLKALDGLRLESATGTVARYSNLGMGLLTLVIARVTGKPFRDVMAERLFRPLKMSSTVWDRADVPEQRGASGYLRDGAGQWRSRHHWQIGAMEGMGGAYSTVSDLAKWVAFQCAAWPPRDSPDRGPVRRATVRESHRIEGWQRPGRALYGAAWGLANLGGDLLLSHMGATWQYSSAVRIIPERGVGVIVLANANRSPAVSKLSLDAIRLVQGALMRSGLYRALSERLPIRPLTGPKRRKPRPR